MRILDYDIGVFYMPFWYYPGTDPLEGNWKLINDYDNYLIGKGLASQVRIPANIYWPSPVWYDEKMKSVTESQFLLMKQNEIDFVVIDSYWVYVESINNFVPSFQHVLENLKDPTFNFNGLDFAIMWCNDFTLNPKQTSCERFLRDGVNGGLERMLTYWADFIFHPNYKKIDGKPVFYIYYPSIEAQDFDGIWTTNSLEGICGFCENDPFFDPLGSLKYEPYINNIKTKFLLEEIERRLGTELYFVAVITTPVRKWSDPPSKDWDIKYDWLVQHPELSGYDAVTSYGYQYFEYSDGYSGTHYVCNTPPIPPDLSYSNWDYDYAKMQEVTRRFYDYMIQNSALDYQVQVSSGFNRGPYNMFEVQNGISVGYARDCNNYARDPLDQAVSTPSSYEEALIYAKNFVDLNPVRTRKIIMLSAWNEYAEGTVIEPTYTWGVQYLNKIKNVFI